MAKSFFTNINLNTNQLIAAVLEHATPLPPNKKGQIVFDSGVNLPAIDITGTTNGWKHLHLDKNASITASTGKFLKNISVVNGFVTEVGSASVALADLPISISDANPLRDGTASPGTGNALARGNHVHPTDTTRAAVNQTMHIGTTAVSINRSSGPLALTGITSASGLDYLSFGSSDIRIKYDSENNAIYVEKGTGASAEPVNFYATGEVSAYGVGSGAGGGTGGVSALSELSDVIISTGVATGDILYREGTHWVNKPQSSLIPNITVPQIGAGNGVKSVIKSGNEINVTYANFLEKDASGNVVISGDLTVNGSTTTINTSELSVDDHNIVLGDIATPTNATANGGGITLKGATDKTITWVSTTNAWTFSEHLNLPTGKEYKINNVSMVSSAGWVGPTISANKGGTGHSTYAVGDLLSAGSTTSLDRIAAVAAGSVLTSQGANTKPAWGKVDLGSHVSGYLPVANGGTGKSSWTAGAVWASSSNVLTSGTLPANYGGTGIASYAKGDLLVANTSTTFVRLAAVAKGSALISNGVGANPVYGKINLNGAEQHVAGVLQITHGGTGFSAAGTIIARRESVDIPATAAWTERIINHGLGHYDYTVSVYLKATGEEVECDVIKTSANTKIMFSRAVAAGEFRITVVG